MPENSDLARWLMGDDTSKSRMSSAMAGPAGEAYREVMQPVIQRLWQRDILPLRTAALVNLAILASINRPHELYTRTLGLLRGGISVEEIREVFLHINVYVGNPAAVEAGVALHEAMQSLEQRGIDFNQSPSD